MDALAEKLDARLREWKPETAAEARQLLSRGGNGDADEAER